MERIADACSSAWKWCKDNWDSSWQDYVGSAVGGLVGGMVMLTRNASLACTVEAGISSFLTPEK